MWDFSFVHYSYVGVQKNVNFLKFGISLFFEVLKCKVFKRLIHPLQQKQGSLLTLFYEKAVSGIAVCLDGKMVMIF